MKGSFRDRMAGGSVFVLSAWLFSGNYFSYTYTNSQESPYGSFSSYTKKANAI